ncbi:MAG: hypothetical protein NT027_05215 [Proteobacteria bacterium]|nr:hypothetical protein [Pseudomonadota bacterium]
MVEKIEQALKQIKDCHTKVAWEDFLLKFGETLATSTHGRLVTEVFKQLSEDPQSLNYGPELWGKLLQGSLACWNLDVGCKIAEFSKKILDSQVVVPGAQILLEGGHPAASRDYAQRALRSVGLKAKERLQLEMIVASSFAEEGKVERAVKALEKLGPSLREAELSVADRANLVNRLGRLHYFTGRYQEASTAFAECAPLFVECKDWESAARSYFNVGACFQNGGLENNSEAFKMVEECRRIAIEHDLKGPLSHCESFYGFESFHTGNFAAARDHFKRALVALPPNDKSFRRLHVMSLLCLTYFATGKYVLAKKFAKQTLDLASLDESDRFKIRYVALEAELNWEDGLIPESMEILQRAAKTLEENGIHTLEKLAALSRLVFQSAVCGVSLSLDRFKIDEQLKHNKFTWLDFQYSCALFKSHKATYEESLMLFDQCLATARDLRSLQFEALSLHGLICCHLRHHNVGAAKELVALLEIAVSRLGDTPIKAKLQCVYAAISYQEGDFPKVVKILQSVEKLAAVSFVDRFAIECCLATISGHSPKLIYDWQIELVARFVKNYFSPSLEVPEPRVFVVSKKYTVNLEKHPALAELLTYLISRPTLGAIPSEIQTDVWKQSTEAQGWHQKIRNAIMRLRDLFPYTMAPIVLHKDHGVRFFANAIGIDAEIFDEMPLESKTRRMLVEGPLSSQQIADRMNISLATAKRTIKRLTDGRFVVPEKQGRNIVYRAAMNRSEGTGSQVLH